LNIKEVDRTFSHTLCNCSNWTSGRDEMSVQDIWSVMGKRRKASSCHIEKKAWQM